MNQINGVLIYKNQFPFGSVNSPREASKLTKVPYTTILGMINREPKKKADKKNGGYTTPDGWGFDWLA